MIKMIEKIFYYGSSIRGGDQGLCDDGISALLQWAREGVQLAQNFVKSYIIDHLLVILLNTE